MVGSSRLEHATLRVDDIDAAVAFYEQVLGLTTVDATGDTVYLGCGLDDRFDLAVTEGGTGLERLAVRLEDEAELEARAERLAEHDVPVEHLEGHEPGIGRAVRFAIPAGAEVEFVLVEPDDYHHAGRPALDGRHAATPLDADHVTLSVEDARANAEFLREAAGFRISEALVKPDGGWRGAFTRLGDWHHELALISGDDAAGGFTVRHLAWTMAGIEHMKTLIDTVTGTGHPLEATIHRHGAGDNLAAYFVEPGGNRFELCAEMATVPAGTPTVETPDDEGYTAWGGIDPPASYRRGSPPSLLD